MFTINHKFYLNKEVNMKIHGCFMVKKLLWYFIHMCISAFMQILCVFHLYQYHYSSCFTCREYRCFNLSWSPVKIFECYYSYYSILCSCTLIHFPNLLYDTCISIFCSKVTKRKLNNAPRLLYERFTFMESIVWHLNYTLLKIFTLKDWK